MWLDLGKCSPFSEEQIKRVQNLKKCYYVADFYGRSDIPQSLFYQPEKEHPDHSHWFTLRRAYVPTDKGWEASSGLFIANGDWVFEKSFGCLIDDGRAIVSRGVHDFRMDSKGNAIDGGSEYVRLVGGSGPDKPSAYLLTLAPDLLKEWVIQNAEHGISPVAQNRFSSHAIPLSWISS